MSIRIYRDINGNGLAARVQFPGFKPDWIEAGDRETLEEKFEDFLNAIESRQQSPIHPHEEPETMTEEQIKHMVDRFLTWKLPEHFNPDCGISFKPTYNEHMSFGPQRHEPQGTNLFDATQAEAMIRHMVDGLPTS